MSAETWEAHTAYLRQALQKLRDPSAPEPDIALLVGNERKPFRQVWADNDPATGEPAVFFTIVNKDRGPRHGPSEVFTLLSFHLAFGGGLSVNDNGSGWAGLRPFGGNHRHMLGRLVRGTKRGQRARQDPAADHHAQDPMNFTNTPARPSSDEPAMGRPVRDREDAIRTSLDKYERNYHRAPFSVSRAEYGQILRDCFVLIDAYFGDDVV